MHSTDQVVQFKVELHPSNVVNIGVAEIAIINVFLLKDQDL